jgi:hypothetical protein
MLAIGAFRHTGCESRPRNDDMMLTLGWRVHFSWKFRLSLLTVIGFIPALSLNHIAVAAGQTEGTGVANGHNRRPFAETSFGFKTGISFAQHCGTEEREPDYEVTNFWRTGLAAAAFLYLPVTSRFGLQQEFAYIQKGSRQDIAVEILEIPAILDVTYDMDYIEIQTLFKFAWLEWRGSQVYSLSGTALCLKVHDRYTLTGEVSDETQTIPIYADDDMSEVDMFDFALVYGTGFEFSLLQQKFLVEYRFTMAWNTLAMPTYAYVPFGEEEILIDNEPVPLKNQNHLVLLGVRF